MITDCQHTRLSLPTHPTRDYTFVHVNTSNQHVKNRPIVSNDGNLFLQYPVKGGSKVRGRASLSYTTYLHSLRPIEGHCRCNVICVSVPLFRGSGMYQPPAGTSHYYNLRLSVGIKTRKPTPGVLSAGNFSSPHLYLRPTYRQLQASILRQSLQESFRPELSNRTKSTTGD